MNEVYRDIDQYIPHLRRYARALSHNAVAADDLVQESLLRALTKSHLYRPGTNLRAWLFTILHNLYISEMRRNVRTGVAVDPVDAEASLATRPNQEAGLMIGALERALRALPHEQRSLIMLVALEGRSYEDVAKSQKLALGTVKSRISRGRSQLRSALEGRGAKDAAVPAWATIGHEREASSRAYHRAA
jgi:RNA polymerase sigma-70 factor (ECF subfamily)